MTERWINATIWRQLRVEPPPCSRFRIPQKRPGDGRFRGRRQNPYRGYLDRMRGNYCMRHNKIVDPE